MLINDDTVRASLAARDLIRLYDAYRANTRAQIAAIQQVQRRFKAGEADARLPIKLTIIKQREALAWHTDAVYAERREQVRRRLYELQDLPELP